MTESTLKRLRELADEPLLPLQTDRYVLLQAELQIRLLQRQVERLALCPDHRDKATGRCVICVAEERTRQDERDRRKEERDV